MGLAEIRARDGDQCSHCGSTADLHVHHRVRRSQCGSNKPCNLITLCARCHHWVHDHPYAANKLGLLLRHGDEPALVPVRHHLWPASQVWLDDELGFRLTEPAQEPVCA